MIKGNQFDLEQVYPISDASLYSFLNNEKNCVIPNRGDELAITTNGLTLTIGTGQAIIQGRLVEMTEEAEISIPANYTGYLVIEIDLSKTNTASGTPGTSTYTVENNQLTIKYVSSLTQDDINDGGLLYHFNLGTITTTTNSITFTRAENIDTPKNDILFNGAVQSGTLTINESFYNFRFLVVFIASSTTSTAFGTGLLPVIVDPPSNMNVICGDTTASNKHSTYMGKIAVSNDSGTQLNITQPFTNVTHNTGNSHGGGTTYYVREIRGIR